MRQPETRLVVPRLRPLIVPRGHAMVSRIVFPGAAAQHPERAVAAVDPGGTVGRCIVVVRMPVIGAPFPDVAIQIVNHQFIAFALAHFLRLVARISIPPGDHADGIVTGVVKTF